MTNPNRSEEGPVYRTEDFEHTFKIKVMERWHKIAPSTKVLIQSAIQEIMKDTDLHNIVERYVQDKWMEIVRNRQKFMFKDGKFIFENGENPEYYED